jgi:hypothetical protein
VAVSSAAVAVLCMIAFNYLELQIGAVSSMSHIGNKSIFDMRFGYTSDEAADLLDAWGPEGRKLYTLIEAIDVFLYCPAYGGLFIVLFNILSGTVMRRGYHSIVRRAYLIVLMLVAVDFVEDALQVGLVKSYHTGSLEDKEWVSMARAASTINQIKWWTVRCGLGMAACMLLALVKS